LRLGVLRETNCNDARVRHLESLMAVGWKSLAGIVGAASVVSVGTLYSVLVREPASPTQQNQASVSKPAAGVSAVSNAPSAVPAPPKPANNTPAANVASPAVPAQQPAGQQAAAAPKPAATNSAPVDAAAKDPSGKDAAAKDAASKPMGPPTFDIVRIEPNGDAVVAGQGTPGATVELLRNGAPFARAVADVGGQWAIVPPTLPKGNCELTLRVTTPDGRVTTSQQAVTVRVPEGPGEEVVVLLNTPDQPSRVLTDGAKPTMHAVADAQAASAPPTAAVSSQGATTPQTGPGTSTPAAGTNGTNANAQTPSRANAAIRTVEGDESGRFFVTGTAEPGATVRIYLNDTPVATVTVAKDGTFGMTVEKGMLPGNYSVRADDVSPQGQVLTRAEVPFVMADKSATATAAPAVVAANQPSKLVASAASPATASTNTRDAAVTAASASGQQTPPVAPATPPTVKSTGSSAASSATQASGTPSTAPVPVSEANPARPTPPPSVAVVPEIRTTTIVQGDNLWRISRKIYGQGIRYTWIYDANSNQIRDPNRIYPGQIFVMPDKKAP
jgi:nucleoid-associated protein YgaU